MPDDEAGETTPSGIPAPIPEGEDARSAAADRVHADGPPEIEDAAAQESEYPADETDEG